MSSRVVLALACALAASPAAAQNLPRLEKMWKDAAKASARVDSSARVSARNDLDTVRAGNLVVLASSSLAPLAQQIASAGWERLQGTFGNQILASRHRPLIAAFYQSQNGPPPYGFPPDVTPIPVAPGAVGARMLVPQTLMLLGDVVRKDFDSQLEHWLRGGVRTDPAEHPSPELFEDLVTSPSPLARACFVGGLDACGSALGLVAPRDAATEWYDAPGRRALVRNLFRDSRDAATFDACVERAIDAACVSLLRGRDSVYVSPPLIFASRELVVRMALQMGGPEAFHRLLASAGKPMGYRLELTSGVTLDSLLLRWHQAVVSSRPMPVDVTADIGWVALGWGLAFGGLVLGSSRWRS